MLIIISITFCLIKRITLILLLKKKSNNTFNNVQLKITSIVDDAQKDMYNVIGFFIPNMSDKLSSLYQKVYQYFHEQTETLFLFILYTLRVTIQLWVLSEVFIFLKLKYIYCALSLLLISLRIKLLFYIRNSDLAAFLIIVALGLEEEALLPITQDCLKMTYKQFILCNKLTGYLDMYQQYNKLFYPYINSFLNPFYLVGWLFCYNL